MFVFCLFITNTSVKPDEVDKESKKYVAGEETKVFNSATHRLKIRCQHIGTQKIIKM